MTVMGHDGPGPLQSTPRHAQVIAAVMPRLSPSAMVSVRREKWKRVAGLIRLSKEGHVVVWHVFDDHEARRTFATKDASRAKHRWQFEAFNIHLDGGKASSGQICFACNKVVNGIDRNQLNRCAP